MAVWAVVIFIGVLAYFWMTLPPIDDLTATTRRPSVTLLGRDGQVIATFGDLFGQPVKLKDLPPYMPEAVIATEDHRFYHHFGIDVIGLVRAAVANLRAGHVVQGGSTLTQQLAKNLFLSPDRTMTTLPGVKPSAARSLARLSMVAGAPLVAAIGPISLIRG